LPGIKSAVRPLLSEVGDFPGDSPLARLGTLLLKTDPGLETYAISRMSARLAGAIEQGEAIVDLNHLLPLTAAEEAPPTLELSPHAEREAASIRRVLRHAFPVSGGRRRIAVLDSGLSPDYLPHRELRYLDYSNGGRLTMPTPPQADPKGHGTRVVSLLDQILPPDVDLSVGRLPNDPAGLTALNIAHALGDIVAREKPEVVNLSVSLRSDWFVCPACRQRVQAPTFLASFLPLVIRLGGTSTEQTVTVMAAGNTGQPPNSRWLTEGVSTLLFAVAENRRGDRTRYSAALNGPNADLYSAGAFGGDDPGDADAQGVFRDGAYGTSYAAPFVSAGALLTKHLPVQPGDPLATQIGAYTRLLIEHARTGLPLRLPPPESWR